MRRFIPIFLLLFFSAVPAQALELTAVSPSTAYPGTTVILAGGPFVAGATVLIGDRRVSANSVAARRLSFTVPALAAGEYALVVEQAGGRSQGPFILRVVSQPPRISSLEPTVLDTCGSSENRTVTVNGSNFRNGTTLLLDSAALGIDKTDAAAIVFTLPPVAPGLHQVQVVNPDNQRSLPYNLIINDTPEISDIELGADRVVEYELLIHGKNFAYNSQVLVNGAAVSRDEGLTGASSPNRDSLRYLDCTTLVYLRRPMAREARELEVQVINPGGAQSNLYRMTTP